MDLKAEEGIRLLPLRLGDEATRDKERETLRKNQELRSRRRAHRPWRRWKRCGHKVKELISNVLPFSLPQEDIRCPTSLSIVKDRSLAENQETDDDVFDPPIDLSSDEEYYVEESRSARLRKSGKERIDNIKKAFSKENMQKTRQNFDKKVNRIRTRIVTPERRERLRQSGERLKQSGERFKKSISNAAPSKEAFKMRSLRKAKDGTVGDVTEDAEEVREMGVDIIARSESLGPISELYPVELSETDREEARAVYPPREGGEISTPEPLKVTFKPQVKVEDDESLLLDLKQ